MITLFNAETDEVLGSITEMDLQHLVDSLEETSPDDSDYYIDAATIDLIGERGLATDHLLSVLRKALGTRDGVDVRWQKA